MNYDAIAIGQTDIAARLRSMKYFDDIYVGAPRIWKDGDKVNSPKTITDKIDEALKGLHQSNGKVGAAVRIFQPAFRVPKTNLPGPQGMFTWVCRCEVHPIINFTAAGTNKYATDIGFQVLRALHAFAINGIIGSLFADGDCFVPYYSEDRKMVTADVLLQSRCKLDPDKLVIMPTINVTATDAPGVQQVELIAQTPGSAIWYSTKVEVYPAESEAGALQYNAPFTAPTGTVVRWAAYFPASAGSFVGFQLIP